MEEPQFLQWPEKAKGGYSVRVWFKTMNGALDWMRHQGVIGDNSAESILKNSERKAVENVKREYTWIRKAVRKWLGRTI